MSRSNQFRMRALSGGLDAADDRRVSPASVYSTILLDHVLRGSATAGTPAGVHRVVDVGCGASPYRDLIVAEHYVGIDHEPMPQVGTTRLAGDATELPMRSSACDAVICTEVIEHVVDEHRLAAELARIAGPGALLILSAPFVHGLHEAPRDFRRLTSIGLTSVLEGAGWEVDRVISVGGPMVVTVDSALRWLDRMARRPVLRTLGPGSGAYRVILTVSRSMQKAAAALTLANPWSALGSIDPHRAEPRLTMGYVVLARRLPDPDAAAAVTGQSTA